MADYQRDKLERFTSEIYESLNKLKELSRLDFPQFTDDVHKVASAKYFLIVAIESAIDLSNHIISKNRFRQPEGYADTFRVLEEEGILEEKFADELEKMARFRNRLVHIYWEVDDEVIYDILNENIEDLDRFVQDITKFLNEDED